MKTEARGQKPEARKSHVDSLGVESMKLVSEHVRSTAVARELFARQKIGIQHSAGQK